MNKLVIGIFCCGLGIVGYSQIYRTYFKEPVKQTDTQLIAYYGISNFGQCVAKISADSASFEKSCDKYFLDYLPEVTDDYHEGDTNPLGMYSPQMVKDTYLSVQSKRIKHNLDPYPALEKLSNGLLSATP